MSEPPALLGDDTAPNPTEVAQAALAACISVGIQAIATHRGVTLTKIEIDIEGDIDISPTWGVATSARTSVPVSLTCVSKLPLKVTQTAIPSTRSRKMPLSGRPW